MRKLILIVFIFIVYFTDATNYYVATDGSGDYTTIAQLNLATFSAGDSVLFRKGDVWREYLQVPSSGTSGNPIVFAAYGTGENPIITGADLVTGFSDGGNNIWDATVTTEPLVVLKSRTLQTNAGSRAAITEEGEWFWTGNTLSVYATSDPSGLVEASNRSIAVATLGRNYLTFRNLVFECTNDPDLATVYTTSTTENSVKFYDCTIQYSAGYGIRIGGNADNAVSNGVLDGCTIRYNWRNGVFVKWLTNGYIINDCDVYSNALDPVNAYNGIWGNLGNFVISNCDVYDNGRGQVNGPPEGIYQYISTGTVTIENCTVHNQPGGSGIRLRGSAIVKNCKIYNNNYAAIDIGLNQSEGEDYVITGNVIYGNTDYAVIVNGSATGVINLTMYNNTIHFNGSQAALLTAITVNNLTVKNNIFYLTGSGYYAISANATTSNIDYNIYHRPTGTDIWGWGGSWPQTFAAWQGLGHDANGYLADPLLVNPPTDLQLQSGSPAIDAGTDVGLTRDFLGYVIDANPDIGAYEYGASPPTMKLRVDSNGKVYVDSNGRAYVIE